MDNTIFKLRNQVPIFRTLLKFISYLQNLSTPPPPITANNTRFLGKIQIIFKNNRSVFGMILISIKLQRYNDFAISCLISSRMIRTLNEGAGPGCIASIFLPENFS